MGKRSPLRPSWTCSLRALIEAGVTVRGMCDTCGQGRDVDLVRLAQIKGDAFDLWNRRTRCRLTAGCQGWNRFYHGGRGRMEAMRD